MSDAGRLEPPVGLSPEMCDVSGLSIAAGFVSPATSDLEGFGQGAV